MVWWWLIIVAFVQLLQKYLCQEYETIRGWKIEDRWKMGVTWQRITSKQIADWIKKAFYKEKHYSFVIVLYVVAEHPSTAFSDRDKQTPTPVDDSPRVGLPHTDSGIGEEGHVAGSLNGSEMGLGLGLGLVGRETDRDRDIGGGGTDLLCSLSDVRRSQESLLDSPHNPNSSQAPPSSISSISQTSKGINVKVGVCVCVCPIQTCLSVSRDNTSGPRGFSPQYWFFM